MRTTDNQRANQSLNGWTAPLGAGLVAAPWQSGFASEAVAAWNAWVFGATVVVLAALAMMQTHEWEVVQDRDGRALICRKARRRGRWRMPPSAAGTVRYSPEEVSMTTTFDEREQAAERRFAYEEEARFHARNRRNQLLATWASERMHLAGKVAEGYVTSVTETAVLTHDDELLARLHADLKAAGIDATLPCLRKEMVRCAALAQAERRVGIALDQGSSV